MGGLIYALLSPSGKAYIGQTVMSLQERIYRHKHDAKKGETTALARAIRKYGIENFKQFVLAKDAGKDWRDFYESLFIALFKSHVKLGSGYNITVGGDGSHGFRHSLEARHAISQKQKGRIQKIETRQRRSASLKLAFAEGRKTKPSPEHIRRMREFVLDGLHRTKGRPCTPLQCENQRKATIAAALVVRGSKWSEERRAKVSKWWDRKLGR